MFFTRLMAAGSKRSVHAMLLALGSATLVFTQQRHQPRLLEAHSSKVEPKWQKLPNPSEKTTEKLSGASFPNAIVREDVDEKLLRLCAVSIRCMLGMCFLDRARAYAFGIYLGSQAVEDLVKSNGDLSSINKMPEPTVTGLAPFYPSGLYEGFRDGYIFQAGPSGLGYYKDSKSPKWQTTKLAAPVLIRLVMLHDVDGEHLAHGFDKTLKSRVVPAMKESKEELAQLTRFRTCLNRLDKIPQGSNLDLYVITFTKLYYSRH